MSITFTSWTAATDGPTSYTLDWSSVAGMQASDTPHWIYLEAIRQAANERYSLINPTYTQPNYTFPLAEYVSPQMLRANTSQFNFIKQIEKIIESGLFSELPANWAWVNYLDNSGSWHNVVQSRVPQFTSMSSVATELGITWNPGSQGDSIGEWALSIYQILNALRWTTTIEFNFTGNVTSSRTQTARSATGATWAAAVATFNATPWTAAADVFTGHVAEWDGVFGFRIVRGRGSLQVANIQTALAHQMQWYRLINDTWLPVALITDYQNNDFVATEDSTQLLYTGTVNSNATESTPIVGTYGDNTMTEPTPRPTPAWGMYPSSSDILLKWDVTGGLTFVA